MQTGRGKDNWFEEVPAYPFIFLRSAAAVLSVFFFIPKMSNEVYLYLSSSFHEPRFAWVPALPPHTGMAIVWSLKIAAVCLFLGVLPRLAAGFMAALGAYLLVLDVRAYQHWIQFHVIVLLFLSVTKIPPLFSIARKQDPQPSHRAWPEYLLAYQIAIVFFYGAVEKMFSPFWQMSGSFFIYESSFSKITEWPIYGFFQFWAAKACLAHPGAASVAVIFSELFIAFAILFRPWRRAGLWGGFFFSVLLELVVMPSLFAWESTACFLALLLGKSRAKTVLAFTLFTALALLRFAKYLWH